MAQALVLSCQESFSCHGLLDPTHKAGCGRWGCHTGDFWERSRQSVSLLWLADVEVDVDELNQEQVADLNKQATTYGMAEGDFVR